MGFLDYSGLSRFLGKLKDLFATKADTVLTTTLSRGRESGTTVGTGSVAFGNDTEASGIYTQAFGEYTSAEGRDAFASGFSSHARGKMSRVSGSNCLAIQDYSNADGNETGAYGKYSSAEGNHVYALHDSEHAFGAYNNQGQGGKFRGLWTSGISYELNDYVYCEENNLNKYIRCIENNSDAVFTQSKWDTNPLWAPKFIETVGIGTSSARINARALDEDGNEYLKGDIYVGCDADSDNGTKLATVTDVSTAASTKADKSDTVLSTTLSRARKANTTVGTGSFAFGYNVEASANYAHAEGSETAATNVGSHAEGYQTIASGQYSHSEGSGSTASAQSAHAEGDNTSAEGLYSHAEGQLSSAINDAAHAEGCRSIAYGTRSHAEGYLTQSGGEGSHAEGMHTSATGEAAHAEGNVAQATADYSHAEGNMTQATAEASHAEGFGAAANGVRSHAEGSMTVASGHASHAEGNSTARGEYSHAECKGVAYGNCSSATGILTTIYSDYGHAGGAYNIEDATTKGFWRAGTHYDVGDVVYKEEPEYALLQCITENTDAEFNASNWQAAEIKNALEVIGNGTSASARSNARKLDWNGNEYLAGNVYVGCNADSSGGNALLNSYQGTANAGKLLSVGNNGVVAPTMYRNRIFPIDVSLMDSVLENAYDRLVNHWFEFIISVQVISGLTTGYVCVNGSIHFPSVNGGTNLGTHYAWGHLELGDSTGTIFLTPHQSGDVYVIRMHTGGTYNIGKLRIDDITN